MGNAIYCRNGHFDGFVPERNPSLIYEGAFHDWQERQMREKLARLSFCPQCGAENLRCCSHCGTTIQGSAEHLSDRPSYCGACGKPFSWTEIALATAEEYTDELEHLSAEEKVTLKATFPDLTTNTARTSLAANRFMKIVGKIGAPAGEMLKKIIVDVITDAAKKALGA